MTEEDSVPQRPRRTYTAEQKAEAVRLAQETGNISQVARDLDLTRSSLVKWIRQAEIDAGQGPEGALTTGGGGGGGARPPRPPPHDRGAQGDGPAEKGKPHAADGA